MTPLSIYVQSQLDKELKCDKPLELTDKILSLMLAEKKDLASFAECLNKFNVTKVKSILYKDVQLNVSKAKTHKAVIDSDKSKEIVNLFNQITTKMDDPSSLYHTLEKLKQHQNLMARFLEAFIYMRMANPSRAQKILMQAMSKDLFGYLLVSDVRDVSIDLQKKMFIYLLKAFKEDLNNEKVTTALIYYLYFHTNGDFSESLDYEFDLPHSLKAVRSYYRSNSFGKSLPFVWGPSIYENSSQKEYISYLDQTKIFSELKKGKLSNLLFYRNMSNINKEQKEVVLKKISELHQSSLLMDKYIFYQLVSDDVLYKLITAHTELNLGIITSGKRTLLKRILNESGLKQFAILSLIGLGDIQEEYYDVLLNLE